METESDNETESEYESDDNKTEAAKDLDGSRMVDSKGHGMVRVCGDEDGHDVHVKQEMQELQELNNIYSPPTRQPPRPLQTRQPSNLQPPPRSNTSATRDVRHIPLEERSLYDIPAYKVPPKPTSPLSKAPNTSRSETPQPHPPPPVVPTPTEIACPICTTLNPSFVAPVCATCSHVLDKSKVPGYWQCQNEECNTDYVNVSDVKICGLCGNRRSTG